VLHPGSSHHGCHSQLNHNPSSLQRPCGVAKLHHHHTSYDTTAMASPQNVGENYWGCLINQDKSATPLLTQLCEGLAKIIVRPFPPHEADADSLQSQLEPGPDTDLTPQRLSIFYRSLGGDDFVFQKLGYPGLSLVYKTLGCFHSLQPTANAFEPPSVPCLLPPGFARWQTLQLLLRPDEHVQYMQKAVELYDVPKPGGGYFPKTIPRESFPSKPDEAMERWHNMVLERLDGGHKRLKNSPYCSPYEAPTRGEGYFPGSPRMRRTSRSPRTDSQDARHRFSGESSHRRSSVPNIPSPIQAPEQVGTYHSSSDQVYSAPNSAMPRSPKHPLAVPSASQRPPPRPYHPHSTNVTNGASTNSTSTKSFNLNFENFHIPFISSPFKSKKRRDRALTSAARAHARPRSPRRSEAISTGSEASSEDSLPRMPRYKGDHRRSSLAPPTEYDRYQRRHSHDASYLSHQIPMPPLPPRSQYTHNNHKPHHHPQVPSTGPMPNLFRQDFFDDHDGQGASSAPESPLDAHINPKLHVIDPMGRDRSGERGRERWHNGETLQERRAVSGERRGRSDDRRGGGSTDRHRAVNPDRLMRKEGRPLRVNTVAGSRGSKPVRTPEVRSAGLPNLRRKAPMSFSGGVRR
jgi:hypothetical protein